MIKKSNGTRYYRCPFCNELKGVCNLQGRVKLNEIPKGFPFGEVVLTKHTIKCFEAKK